MKCLTCATDNPANARFCGNCRQPLGEPAEVSTQAKAGKTAPDQESQGQSAWSWVIAIVLLAWGALFVFGGLAELSGSGTGDEGEFGGLWLIFGGIISMYGGILKGLNKTLFGRFTPGKWAVLAVAAGLLLIILGFSNIT